MQPDLAIFIEQSEKQTTELERKLQVIREESPRRTSKERRVNLYKDSEQEENENFFQKGGLGTAKEAMRVNTEPLEKQKMGIVNTLIGMSNEIRQFSNNIETKLDKAHRQAGKFEKKQTKHTSIDEILEAHS